MITEDRLNDEIINSNKEKEAIQDYYGKIIEQLSSELNTVQQTTVQQTKPNTDEQKQEKAQEIQHIEIKEEQNNNETPKQIEKVNEEKTEDKES